MSFLIPTARPNPSGIPRFGRLLHWCALALAVVFLALAWGAWTQPTVAPTLAHPYPDRDRDLPPKTFAFFAVITALVGRGVRYLFGVTTRKWSLRPAGQIGPEIQDLRISSRRSSIRFYHEKPDRLIDGRESGKMIPFCSREPDTASTFVF